MSSAATELYRWADWWIERAQLHEARAGFSPWYIAWMHRRNARHCRRIAAGVRDNAAQMLEDAEARAKVIPLPISTPVDNPPPTPGDAA